MGAGGAEAGGAGGGVGVAARAGVAPSSAACPRRSPAVAVEASSEPTLPRACRLKQ